jgi:integration host factor subunit alpha
MTLSKARLSDELITKLGLNKNDAKNLVDQFFAEIKNSLEHGIEVRLSGFGNFELRDKNPRPGRNPKTGEEVQISSRRVVTFKAGRKLKEQVEQADLPSPESE